MFAQILNRLQDVSMKRRGALRPSGGRAIEMRVLEAVQPYHGSMSSRGSRGCSSPFSDRRASAPPLPGPPLPDGSSFEFTDSELEAAEEAARIKALHRYLKTVTFSTNEITCWNPTVGEIDHSCRLATPTKFSFKSAKT